MATSSIVPVADRRCERCGDPIPRVTVTGQTVSAHDYKRRVYCSTACSCAAVKESADERFWANVNKYGPLFHDTACWVWTGYINPWGYGQIGTRRLPNYAHRYAYETLIGPVPTGLQLDHLCRNRACVNPAHLEPVPGRENRRRGAGTGGILRTHCQRGHPLTPENMLPASTRCRLCYANRRQNRPRKRCQNCGQIGLPGTKSLCEACYAYQRRTGRSRPVPVPHVSSP
jgi:HNH endonuclease